MFPLKLKSKKYLNKHNTERKLNLKLSLIPPRCNAIDEKERKKTDRR